MKTTLFCLAITLPLGLTACSTASAHPHYAAAPSAKGSSKGQWVLNPRKCPDLVEDWRDRQESRRDEAYDRGPRDVAEDWRDRRESRRDEAVTVCPASAWEWHGPAYKRHYHAPRPVKVNVYYSPKRKRHYHRYRGKRVTVHWRS